MSRRNRPITKLALLAAVYLLAVMPVAAAVDMFLKIEGIDGEAKDNAHRDEIDVLAWSWGMTQQGSTATARAGRAEFSDFTVTKYIDKSSPGLMLACASGKHIPDVKLTVRKAGSSPVEYLVIELKDVMVTSVSTGGEGGEDRLTENVTLNFAEVKVGYTPQRPDGSVGAPQEFQWNVREGRGTGDPARARRR